MKVFQELTLRGEKSQLKQAIIAIEKRLNNGWRRDSERETIISANAPNEIYWFSCTGKPPRRAASLWLAHGDDNTVYLSNIAPSSNQDLDVHEYNQILQEFYTNFVEPVTKSLGIEHTLTSDTKKIEDWVSPETATKLQQFARLANKYTDGSHVLDQSRWFDFLIAAHAESADLDPVTLGRWLMEAEGWPEETASELSMKYAYGQSLLTFYDNRHLA